MKNILVLVGASAVGKTTVAMQLLASSDKYSYIRSATTRAPRNDIHDAEYIYLSREEFERRISAGEMLEFMEYGGNMYGTPKSEIENAFSESKTPLLILDITGVKTLRAKALDFKLFAFYIYEDIKVIERRLYEREVGAVPTTEGLESFQKRRLANVNDFLLLPDISEIFDAFVKNSNIENTVCNVAKLHSEFVSGKLKNGEENFKVAAKLAESVKF